MPGLFRLWLFTPLLLACGTPESELCGEDTGNPCGDPPVSPLEASYGASVTSLAPLHNRSAQLVCERLQADFIHLEPHPLTPGSDACDPGTLDQAGQDAALRATNYTRWLVGLPPLTHYAEGNAVAQACALLMSANGNLSHDPPPDWSCYDAQSSLGAGESNIHLGWSGGRAPTAPVYDLISPFLLDWGANNVDVVGHRRWFLSPSQKDTAFGYAWSPGSNFYGGCWHHGFDEARQTSPHPLPHIAWPSPGPFPKRLIHAGEEAVSWSLSWHADLAPAEAPVEVTVTRLGHGGDDVLPIDLLRYDNDRYGHTAAVVFQPRWEGQAGSYRIEVRSGQVSAQWDTDIIECASP
ncbi:MAG: CAP domain-containing protein [Myxococcota bacterium]|nr:CAP domain-containing protein [Myxococcota bacterium]